MRENDAALKKSLLIVVTNCNGIFTSAEIFTLSAGRPIRVNCASGFRSYLAHRVLTAHGLDSASLDGGLTTLRAARPDAPIVVDFVREPAPASS